MRSRFVWIIFKRISLKWQYTKKRLGTAHWRENQKVSDSPLERVSSTVADRPRAYLCSVWFTAYFATVGHYLLILASVFVTQEHQCRGTKSGINARSPTSALCPVESRRKNPPYPPVGGGPHACSGASCCVGEPFWAHQNAKNLLVAGAPPRTPLGELTALPQTP